MESNIINQPGNSRPAGRKVQSHRPRLPTLGAGRNGAGSMGAAMRSGGHSPPPRGVPAAARIQGSQSDSQIRRRPPADNLGQSSEISDISDALRQQYAAIVQIAEAVHAKAPAPTPTRAEVARGEVARAEAAAEVARVENAQLKGVVEQQQGEISRLRATLMQLQGFAAAAAAPSPASKQIELAGSPPRQAPQQRTPGSGEVNWDASPSNHPPRHGSGLGGEAWVAVLGPCVRQKDQFCIRLAQRLGGQVVRAGPPKPGQDGAAGSQKQLEKLLDALCRLG